MCYNIYNKYIVISFFGYISSSGITGTYSSSVFSSLSILHKDENIQMKSKKIYRFALTIFH